MVRLITLTCLVGVLAIAGPALGAAPQQAPATVGPTVTGGKASLAALRGKPVFINVWSSW
jgi:hypothetical protein